MISQIQVAKRSFLCRVAGLNLRDPKGVWSRATASSRQKDRLRCLGYLIRMSPGTFCWRFSGHMQLVGDPGVHLQHPRDHIYHLARECLSVPQEAFENIAGELDIYYLAEPAATIIWHQISGRKWIKQLRSLQLPISPTSNYQTNVYLLFNISQTWTCTFVTS